MLYHRETLRFHRRIRIERAAAIALAVVYVIGNIALTWPQPGTSRDLSSFLAAGRAAAAGQDPYAVYPLTHRSDVDGVEVAFPNLNPPVALLLFEPLSASPPLAVYRLWYVLSLACYGTALWALSRAYPTHASPDRWLWALCLSGLWSAQGAGQVYGYLAIPAVAAWLGLHRRPRLAGAAIGLLAAIKPNLLVWPALLLLSGSYGAGLAALATAGGLSLLPIFRYGPGIYGAWFAALGGVRWVDLPHNVSLWGVTARLGLAWLGPALALALLAALAAWAFHRRPTRLQVSGPALIGAMLASPLAWPPLFLFVVPALWARRWSGLLRLGAALLLVPAPFVILLGAGAPPLRALLGLIYPLALALILYALLQTVCADNK